MILNLKPTFRIGTIDMTKEWGVTLHVRTAPRHIVKTALKFETDIVDMFVDHFLCNEDGSPLDPAVKDELNAAPLDDVARAYKKALIFNGCAFEEEVEDEKNE
jgi:hypothetical protein